HEEGTFSVIIPMMGVFNNLVLFDQHVPQNSLASIVPDLATSWSWDEDGTALTFTLRQGVRWHDGKPFTAADVKCTFELLAGRGPVSQSRRGHHPGRSRGNAASKAAAAGVSGHARLWLFAGLPLSCAAARHAPAPDRERPVQIRRIQAEPGHQGDPQPGLLEAGAAVS